MQRSKLEVLIIPSSKERGALRHYTKWKVFMGTRVGKELLVKEKKELFQARSLFLRRKSRGSYPADYLPFFWGLERVCLSDYHTEANQKIPD